MAEYEALRKEIDSILEELDDIKYLDIKGSFKT